MRLGRFHLADPQRSLAIGHRFHQRDTSVLKLLDLPMENVIGEGGYGVVYHGELINGTQVAVKRLFNNLGQAEKEFTVEVEAIGHVRHKNSVRLLGYCIEGTHRLLVYEYVNNGNLEQWLHGAMRQHGNLTWEARMKVLTGTAKALAYLHEAIEPKVVHRDIKSSNILIDDEFNAEVSDFCLAKLLGAGKTHIATRVMGTFGYVAPEYANSGLLNEKSDVYSFGVVLLEALTGRDPVDYGRPQNEIYVYLFERKRFQGLALFLHMCLYIRSSIYFLLPFSHINLIRYEGTVWDELAHGKGVYVAEQGLVRYEGEWLQNNREGHGVAEVDIPDIEPIPGSKLEAQMRAEGKIITRDFMNPEDREWLEMDIEDSVRLIDGNYEIPYYENDEWTRQFGRKPDGLPKLKYSNMELVVVEVLRSGLAIVKLASWWDEGDLWSPSVAPLDESIASPSG
ncbi:hypothetical protein KSS87_009422 [Heliosperma pusillum]|nr:hypothetical protein KSS87_009422 [Heliosperma pusillum]